MLISLSMTSGILEEPYLNDILIDTYSINTKLLDKEKEE